MIVYVIQFLFSISTNLVYSYLYSKPSRIVCFWDFRYYGKYQMNFFLQESNRIIQTYYKKLQIPKYPKNPQKMSLKSLLRLAEQYLRRHPSPSSAQPLASLLKLSYTYSTPFSNSKIKKQSYYPYKNIEASSSIDCSYPTLAFDQKTNKLEFCNNFDSILTEEFHEKVLQDPNFGNAKLSHDRTRWLYAAKKKNQKNKSYFLNGSGKSQYSADLGELYDQICEVGIFIWDMKLKKIIPIDIKLQDEPNQKYIFSSPVFSNSQGTKFICHGFKKTQFGYGISYCFNRPVQIFEVNIQNIGTSQMKIKSKKIIKKHQTNIFANISPCFNYLLYFGGKDFVHSYYLDLVVLKRNQEKGQNSGSQVELGYDAEWKEIHRVKEGFIGYSAKTETFINDGKPYAFYQTVENSEQRIKKINLQTGQITYISQNKPGYSYSMSCFNKQTGLITGTLTTHNFNTFFYLPIISQTPIPVPPLSSQQFTLQQLNDPIPGYYLSSSSSTDPQFQKNSQKKPLLVLVHGGPHGHADPCLTLFKYMLLKCGYSILMPNFSGSSGFGNEHLKRAVGNVGKQDAEEIVQLVQNVLQKYGNLDRQRVYVYGGSYGGYMAAIMGSRYHQYFKAAVILNGVLSVPGNFWFSDIPQWSSAESLKESKIHNLTADDYVKMFQQSPISQPMKIPTLQFLGAKDRRVPYRQGLLFDAMTRKVGTPIQTYVYEGAAHSLADSVQTSIDVAIKSMLFLQGLELKQDTSEKKAQQQKKQEVKKETTTISQEIPKQDIKTMKKEE